MLSIVSIDIGLKTFSIYKEYFDQDSAKKIKKPTHCFKQNGEATDDYEDYVLKIAGCGQCMFIEKKELGERKDIFSGKAFLNTYDYLEDLKNKDIFRDVDVIIMEKQLGKNPMATTLMHHVYAWFLIHYRQSQCHHVQDLLHHWSIKKQSSLCDQNVVLQILQ
jgi:hypothetical protein